MRICLIAEGCYPYVAGGVSSWIQMLVKGMPQHEFVLCTIGATKDQRGVFKYEIPENIVEIHENFLDELMEGSFRTKDGRVLAPKEHQAMLDLITKDSVDWDTIFDMFGRGGRYKANQFLSSRGFLDIVKDACQEEYRMTPFNDVFWTIRSMLLPILNIMACSIPQVDVFHSVSTGYAGLLGAMFQHKTGRPLLLTEHGIYTREREEEILKARWVDVYFKQTWINFFAGMSRAAYHKADRIFSLFYKARELEIELGAPAERCSVIPNGIKMSRFQDIPPIADDGHPLVLGAVIRAVPIKDLKTMIHAFDLVRRRMPEAKLYLIGPTDEDPEYYQECLDLIRNLECTGITFVGRVNVAEWYGQMDILLLSSVSEGQPFVILEAMASHRPVIATDVGSCRELVEGNEDGFGPSGMIVPVMNPSLMARAILQLGSDRAMQRAMGEAGFRRVDRFYREEDFLAAYEKEYEEVKALGGRGV